VFRATCPSLFFDQLRIPYRVEEPGAVWAELEERHPLRAATRFETTNGHGLRFAAWPAPDSLTTASTQAFVLESLPLYGRLLDDATCADWLRSTPDGWRRTTPIRDPNGRQVGSLWRDGRGNAFLPFEPDEIILNFLSEAYKSVARMPLDGAAGAAAKRLYYRTKHALPRTLQIRLRRLLSGVQARTDFPRWPIEPALIEFSRLLFLLLEDTVAQPIPWISPWPKPYSWSLVLTHDVETARGFECLHLLRDIELEAGCRSSWNFVPIRYESDARYDVRDDDVRGLTELGFEVGVHGFRHDGRDLSSLATLRERLPRIQEYASRWSATGFRSPAMHRRWEWMPMLPFDYDCSYPDTDPFEPQGGGCCSWLPYFNRNLVELPTTLPQDHTLFAILGRNDESDWVDKTTLIRRQGGMALLLTHPDYMTETHLLDAYRRYLARFGRDQSVWLALPREVSAWWRRRAESRLVQTGDGSWEIVGPAAGEGRPVFGAPKGVA